MHAAFLPRDALVAWVGEVHRRLLSLDILARDAGTFTVNAAGEHEVTYDDEKGRVRRAVWRDGVWVKDP